MKTKKKYQSEIEIPKGVTIEKKKDILIFTGPLGSSKSHIKKLDRGGSLAIDINREKKSIGIISSRASTYGSFVNFIRNKIYGVSQGYLLYLRVVGIGYRWILQNNILTLKVGFSHDVRYKIPNSIQIFLLEPTLICLFSVDKHQVTQIALQIKEIRPPSPYKGKGIRFEHEEVRIKQGKQK